MAQHITDDLTSFLFGDNSFVIHFFRREKLRASMNDQVADPKNGSEVIFSLSARSREEVDEWSKRPKPPVQAFSGNPAKTKSVTTTASPQTLTVISSMCFALSKACNVIDRSYAQRNIPLLLWIKGRNQTITASVSFFKVKN